MKFALTICILLVASLCLGIWLLLGQKKFGAFPEGERQKRIQASPNWRGGVFANTVFVPRRTEGVSFARMMWRYWFGKKERLSPQNPLPSVKTDLTSLDSTQDMLVWFGHSSFFLQQDGIRILADPVFSPNAAPFSFSTKAFPGTGVYTADDMPPIDYLLISHDHWDHLDFATAISLRANLHERAGKVVCPLGVGAHLEHWGFDSKDIIEADWGDALQLQPGFALHFCTTRHFSGRTLRADQSLWTGFLLETPARRIYYSGDGGYGEHFAAVGRKFGPIDLAILENGQYDANWKYMHMLPEETARAATDLQTKALLPVHSAKFSIASHAWDDPLQRIVAASHGKAYRLLTPMIGEPVYLDGREQVFSHWWEGQK